MLMRALMTEGDWRRLTNEGLLSRSAYSAERAGADHRLPVGLVLHVRSYLTVPWLVHVRRALSPWAHLGLSSWVETKGATMLSRM